MKRYVREIRECYEQGQELKSTVTKKVLQTAMDVCQRRTRDLNELIDDPSSSEQPTVSEQEWRTLARDELNEQSLAQKKHMEWCQRNDVAVPEPKKKKKKKKAKKKLVQE